MGDKMKTIDDANTGEIKRRFLEIIDGVFGDPPIFEGIDSFRLGICKLECIDSILHIYLRRPGLIIGKGGFTINSITDKLGVPIVLHTVILLR